ncbi:MAG TPA: methylmalonyl-CoA epimerase [Acidobacteriota bacterium]|nr:methylmalonyl-CoA epimerase [Acidobacteriota bacterium]HQO20777.1 methylmalonyl-CoA epimerase [Acidobacteriota bacterium]HQQ47604.1 methylmalonyl-CoA epimerase [Acidobacteriota bacterium]
MKLDHIGIAVESIEKAKIFYEEMGLTIRALEEVPEQKVRVAVFPVGESRIELLETLDPEGPVGKFLAKKGQGLHHIAMKVDDIRAAIAKLKEKGVEMIDREPRRGAEGCLIAFVHPRSTGGVLLELTEKKDE